MTTSTRRTGKGAASQASEAGVPTRLSEAFQAAVLADFQQHGQAAIAKMRDEKPDQYFEVVAAILPKAAGGEGNEAGAGKAKRQVIRRRFVDANR